MENVSSIKIKPVLSFLICFSIYLFLTSNFVTAQSGKIKGIIKEESTGNLLAGANCILLGTAFGTSSDLNGEYQFLNIPAGFLQFTSDVHWLRYSRTASASQSQFHFKSRYNSKIKCH